MPIFSSGYLALGRWGSSPIRFHWTVPLGALLFGGFTISPVFWAGFVALVLAHELGHAWLVRRLGHRVVSVDVTGFGGLCRWEGRATARERAIVAWGGVVAQALVLLGMLAALALPGRLPFESSLTDVFVRANLWLIGLNLLPVRPLDGAEAWPLVAAELRAWRRRRPRRPRAGAPDPAAARALAEALRRAAVEAGRARRPD